MSHAFCEVAKVGVFCDAVAHSTEKRKDGEVKVLQLTLRIQPFDAKLATAIRQVVRTTLFKLNHPEPHGHLRRVGFELEIARQQIVIHATPDTVKATIAFNQVRIADVYARTEKNVGGFAFVFKAIFGPPSARELEYVEHWRNGQAFLTFEAAEPSADFETVEDEDEAEEDDAQPRLPAHDFDTDPAGAPVSADDDTPIAQAARAVEADREPVRQRIRSHAEGRKKRGRTTTH